MISIEHQNKVAVLRLNRGVTNALNHQLVTELTEALRAVKASPEVHSLVISSANDKFLSIGFDIPELYGLSRQEFMAFYNDFNRLCLDLYTLPKPTVAAVTGHAVAGGCIVALCCDYRFIAEGRRLMGLNEAKLGVPVPYLADCILQSLIGVWSAREVMDAGEFYLPDRLLRMGMVDQVLPAGEVVPKAVKKAEEMGAMPLEAFETIKRSRVETVAAKVLARLTEEEQYFIERWYSPEARERLREAAKKF